MAGIELLLLHKYFLSFKAGPLAKEGRFVYNATLAEDCALFCSKIIVVSSQSHLG